MSLLRDVTVVLGFGVCLLPLTPTNRLVLSVGFLAGGSSLFIAGPEFFLKFQGYLLSVELCYSLTRLLSWWAAWLRLPVREWVSPLVLYMVGPTANSTSSSLSSLFIA